ncbi:hypothetical protein SAMN06297251_10416 [Fulvimarina manganoxydans]|uniref:Uncharacterized protein n=1 Tax=Fulvimarina manganoxydans TaxID=937218 RepID=A0A1W2A7L8_9HYPH|nr:hypothetical protein [Fulvimarina manganoxydans]SMC56739.1 hypothetical protein SAMN06297251_10416 [Fulvimarina manganoxydans]
MTEDRDPEIRTDDPAHYRFLALIKRVAGGIYVDDTQYVLGVAKRTAERWLGGKPVPDPVIERLERDAPLVEAFGRDLHDVVKRHRDAGLSEHYMRLRMRQYAKTLSETAPKDGE